MITTRPHIITIILSIFLNIIVFILGIIAIISNKGIITMNILVLITGIFLLYPCFIRLPHRKIVLGKEDIYVQEPYIKVLKFMGGPYSAPWSSINSITSSFPYWWPYKIIILRSDYKGKTSYFPLDSYYTNFKKAVVFAADKVPIKCFDEHSRKLVEIYKKKQRQ